MSFIQIVLIVSVLLYFLYYLWIRRQFYILSWKLQSFNGLPFIGLAHKIGGPANLLFYMAKERFDLKKLYGIIWFGSTPMFYVSEPNLIKKILTSNHFLHKHDFYELGTKMIGHGLISANPPFWHRYRKVTDPAFKLSILKNYMNIFNEKSDLFVKNLMKYVKKNIDDGRSSHQNEFDIMKYAQLCSMDIVCQTTMGQCMNFQLNENLNILQTYDNLLKSITKRTLNPVLHIDFLYNLTKASKLSRQYYKFVSKFVENLIQNQTSKLEAKKQSPGEQNHDKLLEIENEEVFVNRTINLLENNQLTWNEAIENSNILIAAGYETTANTVSYAIICLAMFPEYQNQLFHELLLNYPNKNNCNITYENLSKLTYLDMIINESMRLIAPVPLIGRKSTSPIHLSDLDSDNSDDEHQSESCILPKNTQIIIDIFNMQRDTKIWGPNAKTFDPDHFLPENLQKLHSYAFLPFSKGTRQCIGVKYAGLTIKTIVAKLIRQYEFTTDFQFDQLKFLYNITTKLETVPQLRIKERQI